jgi:hypothetical protein
VATWQTWQWTRCIAVRVVTPGRCRVALSLPLVGSCEPSLSPVNACFSALAPKRLFGRSRVIVLTDVFNLLRPIEGLEGSAS